MNKSYKNVRIPVINVMVVSEWIPYLVVAVVDIAGVSYTVQGTQYALLHYMSW